MTRSGIRLAAFGVPKAGDRVPARCRRVFGSTRPGGLGGQDIYRVTVNAEGSFGAVSHMPELSSSADDARPIIRHDGLELFLQSARPDSSGNTDVDLWVATRPNPDADWTPPTNLTSINTDGFDGGPSISSDRQTLCFFSNGRGGSGSVDLFTSTRSKETGND